MADYVAQANEWEAMWRLDAGFPSSWEESIEELGREQVTFPDPWNVVNLAMRLIDNEPRISVPAKSASDEDISLAERTERFLEGVWQRCSKQQQRDIVDDAKWLAFVPGACVFEVLWIRDSLPEALRDQNFPVMIRVLDPRECFVKRGALFTEWAFRKYKDDLVSAKQRYPNLAIWDKYDSMDESGVKRYGTDSGRAGSRKVEIIDFWYSDRNGNPWNCIMVEQEFAKKPKRMRAYPYIPFVETFGDTAPVSNPVGRRISIIAPLNGVWQYKCRLGSNMGTAVLYSTWPATTYQNEFGTPMGDVDIRPGMTVELPWGSKLENFNQEIRLDIVQAMMGQLETSIQQATFPSVMHGDASGMQAGYGLNLMTQAAMGRISSARKYLEMAMESVNELVLALIEHNGDEKGVDLFALSKTTRESYIESLSPPEINGYYRNIVSLAPGIPQDENAHQAMGKQLADGGYISGRTLRSNYLGPDVPADEEERIWAERAMNDPEIAPRLELLHFIKRFPDSWKVLIRGTAREQIAMQMDLLPPPEPPPGMFDAEQALGEPPMMGEEMMPPEGGPSMQPPSGMVGPEGGAMGPEQMAGQMSPENLGLPAQGAPLEFSQIMNTQPPPAEELDMIAGQGGPPPLR